MEIKRVGIKKGMYEGGQKWIRSFAVEILV